MMTSVRQFLAGFRRRPTRLFWLLPLLMAMDGPGCVMSEQPLTRAQRDAVDTEILGYWVESDSSRQEPAIWIGTRDRRTMEVRQYADEGGYIVLTGYRSTVGEHSYANLQYTAGDCDDCTDAERAEVQTDFAEEYADLLPGNPQNDCTWLVFRYQHVDDELTIWLLEDDRLEDAADRGELSFRERTDEPGADYAPCITESRRALRKFVSSDQPAVFTDDFRIVYTRPEAVDGDD